MPDPSSETDPLSVDEGITLTHRAPTVRGSAVFVVATLLFASLFWLSPKPVELSLVLFLNLAALSWYDLHYFRLPNLLTATLALASIALLVTVPQSDFVDHVTGGLVGLAFFPLLNFVYQMVRGRSGIGLGDAKLLGGIGLWLGWQSLPFVLLTASVTALAVVSLFMLFASSENRKQAVKKPVPFGVFLSIGAWSIWLFPFA